MKSAMKIIVGAFLGILTLMMILTTNGRMNRSMEIKSNLSSAIEGALEELKLEKSYNIDNADQFLADFTESMSMAIDSDAEIKTEIMNVDKERGLLSIRVTETFTHPNGNEGTVSEERTVILNRVTDDESETYTVRFYVVQGDQRAYKKYTVVKGDVLSVPVNPTKEGMTFGGWVGPTGADITAPIESDLEFYGTWY